MGVYSSYFAPLRIVWGESSSHVLYYTSVWRCLSLSPLWETHENKYEYVLIQRTELDVLINYMWREENVLSAYRQHCIQSINVILACIFINSARIWWSVICLHMHLFSSRNNNNPCVLLNIWSILRQVAFPITGVFSFNYWRTLDKYIWP